MKLGVAPDTTARGAYEELQREVAYLREQLREAHETLEAIRNGDVDAVVVSGADDIARVYTLETADESYRLLVQEMQEGALTLNRSGDILYCNARMGKLLGSEPERIIGNSLRRFIVASDWPAVLDMIASEGKGEIDVRAEHDVLVPTHVSFSCLRGGSLGNEDIYCGIVTDLTEQKRTGDQLRVTHEALLQQVAERERTERLLRHSQKMEAVGQLTGGIAHDFNNLLMVITGGLSILDRDPPPERRQKLRDGMRQAAARGAALTRQLLAFSRQKELRPKRIVLPCHVSNMRELLDGSLGGDVRIETAFDTDIWPVEVDEGELEIALLNLCVNARDAMPNGGSITIAARNRPTLDEFELSGDFVELSVADTGEGMDAETMSRCLEPFYTTKDIGRGSGLGLAQVYGFARGSRGAVRIDSGVGIGTRVSMLLPRTTIEPAEAESELESAATGSSAGHAMRVLLVEDDASVAALTTEMLQELGFSVSHVASAHAGLAALGDGLPVEAIISDVMMPGGMDGLSFVKELRRRGNDLPVLLVTGHAEAVKREAESAGFALLAKPYGLDNLAQTLDRVMSRHRARR